MELKPNTDVDSSLLPIDVSENLLDDTSLSPRAITGGSRAAAKTSLLATVAKLKILNLPDFDIEKDAEINLFSINTGGEQALRDNIREIVLRNNLANLDAAALEAIEAGDIKTFNEVYNKGGLRENIGFSAGQYELEKQGVDGLKDLGLNDLNQVEVSENIDFDQDEFITDSHKKIAIMQNSLAKAIEENSWENTGLAETILNYAAMFVPFNLLTTELGGAKRTTLTLQTGKAFNIQRTRLMNMSMPEFEETWDTYLKDLSTSGLLAGKNETFNVIAIREMLDGLSKGHELTHSIFAGVEVLGSVADAALLFKYAMLAKNSFKFTKTINRSFSSDRAAKTINNSKDEAADLAGKPDGTLLNEVYDIDEAIEVLLPGNAAKTQDLSVGLSGDILKELDAQETGIRNILNDRRTERLNPEEALIAFEAEKARLLEVYKGSNIMDVRLEDPSKVTGLRNIAIYLGRASGKGGYSTEKAALNAIKTRNLGKADVIQDPSGQWFIKQTHIMPEQGYVIPNSINDVRVIDKNAALITNPLGWLPLNIAKDLQISFGQKARMNKFIRTELRPAINALSGAERRAVSKVLELGEDFNWVDRAGNKRNGKWWTSEELDVHYMRDLERLPSDKERLAYYTYKNINDLDWTIRNTWEYTKRARLGYKRILINSLELDERGRVLTTLANPENARIFDLTSNKYLLKGELTSEELSKRLGSNSILVRLEQPLHLADDPVDLIIGSRGDFHIERLDPNVLPYREGGHRIYTGNYFIKQARMGTYTDGAKWKDSPLTQTVFESVKDATKYAKEHEAARLAVIKAKASNLDKDIKIADELLNNIEIKGIDDWDQLVKEGGVVEDFPFEVVFDRKLPKAYDEAAGDFFDLTNREIYTDDTAQQLMYNNQQYTGRRGERLKQPKEMEAKVLDPFAAQDMALRHAIKTNSLNDFRVRMMEEWVSMAKGLNTIDPSSVSSGSSLAKIFSTVEYLPNANAIDIQKLENLRKLIKRKLKQTTFDDIAEQTQRIRFAEWVEGKTGIAASKVLDFTQAGGYLGAMRGITYDVYLGMFNVGQLMFQLSTAAGLMAMKGDLRSLPAGLTLRRALARPDLLDDIATNWKPIHGMEPEEFKKMFQELEASGFANIEDSNLWLEGAEQGISRAERGGIKTEGAFEGVLENVRDLGAGISKAGGKARHLGRRPVYEAELLNRLVGWNVAWKEGVDLGLKPGSRELFRHTLDRANSLTLDMGEASRTILQEGPQALMFQFQQYANNIMQNVSRTKGMQGFSRWNDKEKWRFIVGQLALYGSATVPYGEEMLDWTIDAVSEGEREDQPSGALYKFLQTGAIDALLLVATDGKVDTAYGFRTGFGVGLKRTLGDMWTEKTGVEIVLGPSYNVLSDFSKSILNAMDFISSSANPDGITIEAAQAALMEIARNISSVKDVEKASMIYRKGLILSRSGNIQGQASKLQALATLLGFPTSVEHDISLMFEANKASKETINEIAKQMTENNTRAALATSEEEWQMFKRVNQALLKDEDLRTQNLILKQVKRRTPQWFYQEIANKNFNLKGSTSLNKRAIEKRLKQANKERKGKQ